MAGSRLASHSLRWVSSGCSWLRSGHTGGATRPIAVAPVTKTRLAAASTRRRKRRRRHLSTSRSVFIHGVAVNPALRSRCGSRDWRCLAGMAGRPRARGWLLAGFGVIALGIYGFVATLQPDAHFSRSLPPMAAYSSPDRSCGDGVRRIPPRSLGRDRRDDLPRWRRTDHVCAARRMSPQRRQCPSVVSSPSQEAVAQTRTSHAN